MNSKEIIERIKMVSGLQQKEIASEIFGISNTNLSNKIKRGSLDIDALIKWSDHASVNLHWLLTGEGTPSVKNVTPAPTAKETPQASNVITLRHMELVKGFKDKPGALDMNTDLMDIENLDPETYKRVKSYIKGTADTVREVADRQVQYGTDRRQAERRIEEAPDKHPNGVNRRTGEDRRKAATLKTSALKSGGMSLL